MEESAGDAKKNKKDMQLGACDDGLCEDCLLVNEAALAEQSARATESRAAGEDNVYT
jgi:hypothetical protein